MAKEKIGDLVVEFSATGQEDVDKKMEELKGKADAMAKAIDAAFGHQANKARAVGDSLGGVSSAVSTAAQSKTKGTGDKASATITPDISASSGGGVGSGIGLAIAGPVGAVMGALGEKLSMLAMAGVSASADIAPLNMLLEKASRVMGGAFAPALDVMTEVMGDLMEPIQDISRVIGDTLGTVLDGLRPVIDALVDSLKIFASVLGDLADVAGVGKSQHGYRELTPNNARGAESVTSAYSRVAAATVKSTEDGGQKNYLERIEENTRRAVSDEWARLLFSMFFEQANTGAGDAVVGAIGGAAAGAMMTR